MIIFGPRTTRPNYGDSDFWTGSNWTTNVDFCMPNCTVYVAGRCSEAGIPHPTGFDAYHDFTSDGWSAINSLNDVEPGDVIEYDDHTICFVESGKGRSAICSHSWYTTSTGRASPGYRLPTDPTGDTAEKVWNYCVSRWPNRCWFTHTAGGYTSGSFKIAYRPPGGGGGGSPDEPPVDPPPGEDPSKGEWVWVEETITSVIPHFYSYDVIFECGDQTLSFKGKGGTQDNPKAPHQIKEDSADRLNQRWDPFNMYTYERTLTYHQDKSPNWSNWDLKYQGSENISMGNQPLNPEINGWKMNWDDSPSPTPGPTPPGPTPEPDDYQYYDAVIEMPESKELDLLYTADIHAGWNNYGGNRWPSSHMFSLDTDQVAGKSLVGGDVKAYQNKLIAAGIPTYLLDCGDWSKGANYQSGDESTCVNRTIEILKGMNYFGITTGNWEWKWDISTAFSYLNSMKNYGLMACNVNDSNGDPLFPGGRHPDFPGCKAIKVGDKKIALIAVGYPSPNGYDTYGTDHVEYNGTTYRWNYKENGSTRYRWFDSSDDASLQQNGTVNPSAGGSVYRRVQGYIDQFKNTYGFDYIIVFSHLDKYSDENYSDDDRFFSRADFLIKNTSGINVVIPGHLNAPIENTYTYSWKNGSGSGIIAPEAGGEMNSFGRLRINLETDKISFKLLKSLNDIRSA